MKIILPTIGTRGDVQPYIARALGMQKVGHTVTLATHPCLHRLVESYGVPFAPMGPDIDIGHEAAMIRAQSPNFLVGFQRVMKFSFSMLEQAHPDLLELCHGQNLVVVSHTAAGSMEADKLRLMTINAAYALNLEQEVGSLEAGKCADLMLLSDNPLDLPAENLLRLQVHMTLVGGETLYCDTAVEAMCP